MMISEVSDARELRRKLTPESTVGSSRAHWVWWAPGDCTRYRLTYVNAVGVNVAFHQILVFETGGRTLAVPYTPHKPWTVESFLRTYGETYAGWWAGIRPALAAYGWTSTRPSDLSYSAGDANVIGALLAEGS